MRNKITFLLLFFISFTCYSQNLMRYITFPFASSVNPRHCFDINGNNIAHIGCVFDDAVLNKTLVYGPGINSGNYFFISETDSNSNSVFKKIANANGQGSHFQISTLKYLNDGSIIVNGVIAGPLVFNGSQTFNNNTSSFFILKLSKGSLSLDWCKLIPVNSLSDKIYVLPNCNPNKIILIGNTSTGFQSGITNYPAGSFFMELDGIGNIQIVKSVNQDFTGAYFFKKYKSIYINSNSTVYAYDTLYNLVDTCSFFKESNFDINPDDSYSFVADADATKTISGEVFYNNKNYFAQFDTSGNILFKRYITNITNAITPNVFIGTIANTVTKHIAYYQEKEDPDSITGCNKTISKNSITIESFYDNFTACNKKIFLTPRVISIFPYITFNTIVRNSMEMIHGQNGNFYLTLPYHNIPDTFEYTIQSELHKYPLAKFKYFPRKQGMLLHFNFDKWIEAFVPDKLAYCVGDTIKLGFKKYGEWNSSTIFKLEGSSNPDFPVGQIRSFGTWKDSILTNDSLIFTNLKIPNMGGGQFYLRIKSTNPDRISNIADTTITIFSQPSVNAGKDTIVCEGDSAQLNGNNFNNSFYWTSSIPNIIVDSLQLNSKVFTTDSAYCVLHTKNSPGCENTDTVFIHVIPKINLAYTIDSVYPKCINTNLKVSISTSYNDSIMVSWGDGTDTVLKNNTHPLQHFYNTIGLKNVSIKAIANRCMDSSGFAISVRPPFQFAASVDTTICKGGTANLWVTASGGDSAFNYILISPTTLVVNSNGIFSVSPDTTTNYNIGRINICANDTVWKTIIVTVKPPLALTLNTIDTTICKGTNFTIIATATCGNGFYQYALKKNNIIQQSNTSGSFNITATANEIYTVVLSDNCTVLNDSLTVNIKIFPDLQFTQILLDAYLCPGESIILKANTNNGSGAVTYQWKDGTGTILSLTDSLQITPFTTNQIILKVTDVCTSIYDTIPLYQFAVAGGTQLNTDVQSGCVPLTINFETPNLTHSNSQPCEAIWDFGDGNTQTQNFDNTNNQVKTKHVYTLPGIFTATVKLKFKNRATECYTFTTTIEALDIPQIQLIVTPKKITLPKTQCTATVTTTNADSVVIDWADGYSDNFNTSVAFISQTHDYSDTGHYTIKATAYNKNTCYIETFAKVFHADTFMCFIPNAFTANRDNLNETFKPVVSYCKSYELIIFNRWGEEVYRENYTAGKNAIVGWNGEGQVADTYVYMLTTKDGDNNRSSFKGTVMLLR